VPQLSVPSALRRPARVASVVAVGLSLTLVACGGSDSSSSASANGGASTTGRPGDGGGFNLTAAQTACLKKEGVTLPGGGQRPGGQRPNGTGTTPNGAPPAGARTTPNGAPPNGGPPTGGQRGQGGPGGANFQKLQAAMKKCGIDMPQRPQGAPGQGQGGQGGPGGGYGQPPAQGQQQDSSGSTNAS